jgi:RNA polymerase primary sigma factor
MSDTLSTFFKDVGKTKLLTREEEVTLSKRIEKGDRQARDHMISANIRLAISIAKKYQNRGCPLEDLIQEANIGLMKAVDRFDWRRGFKFSTYGCWWIKQSVMRHIASNSNSIRLPSHAKGMLWKMKRFAAEFEEEFGVPPSQPELAELLGVSLDTMRAIIDAASTPVSLDSSISYSGSSGPSAGRKLSDVIPDANAKHPSEKLDEEKITEVVRQALGSLSDREEKILRLRFGIYEDPEDHKGFPITNRELDSIKKRAVDSLIDANVEV